MLRSSCTATPSFLLAHQSREREVASFGMELPLASLARAFEAGTAEAGLEPRFHVAEAAVEALDERVAAELTLAGELCGSVALEAQPVFSGEDGVIELTAGELAAGESERARAAGVDPAALARQLTHLPRLAAPLSLGMLRAAPVARASLFSDPEFSLSARVSSRRAAGAAARGVDLGAWVEARGSLVLEQK